MRKIRGLILCLLFLLSVALSAQYPTVEIRAVWLTTSWGLDWPTQGKTVEQQKSELCDMLDEFRKLNFNIVFFQVRARGTTFYKSAIEPQSSYFNKKGGFDPLTFAVEECHKRGMECHAWFVTFPMNQERKPIPKNKQKAAAKKYPEHYKLVKNQQWYMDPGHPKTKERILALTKEIVSNYDIDGIQYDYIRYPNNDRTFPDNDTFKKYGKGKSLHDWRRDNINSLVDELYDTVKGLKPWVQVSSSPLGRYKVLPHAPNDGWTAYETVFQDAAGWLQRGKHDMLFPMMYYREELFEPFVVDWVANSNGRPVTPGLGVYQMLKSEKDWPLKDITKQMDYTRQSGASGQAYFRAKNITENLKGVKDSIRAFYPYQAKLPPLTWLDNVSPNSPLNLQVYRDDSGKLHIAWEAPDDTEDFTYTVYYSSDEWVDMSDPKYIIASGIRGNSITLPVSTGNFGFYYTVTASDRFHNESVPAFAAYFSHSKYEQ
ncbi:glycoside hydrolase family 10 protein [Dysgonomonas sp. 25]|uniref:glycoside hydrolase family 10 protein n=1 Tax=Dysgonomonas sp. 25 TaxID=2302933 RepID=UPI0013D37554|nr:family 10 glycosylhydrolase [Dysgonomonas sp. 25]NDV68270.1 hypothetical protein [Dysgonomonas sp. 25]